MNTGTMTERNAESSPPLRARMAGESAEKTREMKIRLSTMWIFAVLNYIYCDILAVMGHVYGTPTTGFLLGATVLMEIPMLMVLLARYLPFKTNRWANVAAGLIMSAVEAASIFVGRPPPFYLVFAAIEIACTLLITWFAWTWKESQAVAIIGN